MGKTPTTAHGMLVKLLTMCIMNRGVTVHLINSGSDLMTVHVSRPLQPGAMSNSPDEQLMMSNSSLTAGGLNFLLLGEC
jgi:hypothetical protein